MVRFIIIIVLLFALYSCGVNKSSKKRFIDFTPISDPYLRLDGYYYHINKQNREADSTIQIIFLYSNGLALVSQYSQVTSTLEGADKYYTDREFGDYNKYYTQKELLNLGKRKTINPILNIQWMNFFLDKDSIAFEKIYPMKRYPHYLFTGQVLNDSTFLIRNRKGVYHIEMFERRVTVLSDTFHFRELLSKPDSTISFYMRK